MGDLVVADVGVYSDPGASLVTTALYQSLTGDTDSATADVALALVSAQKIVEEYLRRPLANEERTETVRFSGGRLYPKATPITEAPDGITIVPGSRALVGASPDGGPFWPAVGDSTYPASATITYTGGYTASTLPRTIAAVISSLAYQLLHVTDDSEVPAGATSVSVGDVSVSFGDGTDPGVELNAAQRQSIKPWRRRFV